jgi:ABC-type phosphate/phosphonate transport system substrate-binding protein
MNPPAAWTFPVAYAQQTQQYLPGQPLTQADATNQANGDLTAAVSNNIKHKY